MWAAKLSPYFTEIEDTLHQIIEDIRITKNFNRGALINYEIFQAAIRLSSRAHLRYLPLERNMLTAEQWREQYDSLLDGMFP